MGTYIEWRDGIPHPAYAEPYTAEKAEALTRAATAVKYEPRYKCESPDCYGAKVFCANENHPNRYCPESEERFRGLTLLEVGEIRRAEAYAHGDLEAGKAIQDRLIGKPKQTVHTTNMSMSYKDYLGIIAEKRKAALEAISTDATTEAPHVVTVTVTETENLLDGI